eukprot:gene391-251_t
MSIFMAMDLESFNRFFDVFVWIYLVAAIAVVVSFRKRQATSDSAATPEPVVYSLKKKKLLRTEVKNPKKKMTTNMIRRIEDNDVLYLKVTNVKDEGGAECSFECTFKRTG